MFGERLRECRVIAKETQDELGALVGVSQRTISSWEKELREPPYETFIFFCKHFSVSADYLLGIIDERTKAFTPTESETTVIEVPSPKTKIIYPYISEADMPKNQNDLAMFMRGFAYCQSLKSVVK